MVSLHALRVAPRDDREGCGGRGDDRGEGVGELRVTRDYLLSSDPEAAPCLSGCGREPTGEGPGVDAAGLPLPACALLGGAVSGAVSLAAVAVGAEPDLLAANEALAGEPSEGKVVDEEGRHR